MLFKQFIGKYTWLTLAGIICLHFLAYFVRGTSLEAILLLLVAISVVIIARYSLRNGLLIAFAEIFVGGHGHLLDFNLLGFSFSLRMAIFVAIMAVWVIFNGKRFFEEYRFEALRDLSWILLAVVVALGFIIGLANNGFTASFDDMNGYVTLFYILPILSLVWDNKARQYVLHVLSGCIIWLTASTIFLAYIFSHVNGKALHVLYAFVRDSRLAEITLQVIDNKGSLLEVYATGLNLIQLQEYWYRIFMPAQFFVVIGMVLIIASALFMWRASKMPIWIYYVSTLLMMAIFLSFSRSFLLGLMMASIFLFVISWFSGKKKFISIPKRVFGLMLSGVISVVCIWSIIKIEIPARPDLTEAIFFQTSAQTGRTEAVTSRWNLLTPMMESIYRSPILGSGFGTSITYISDDPRLRAEDATGTYTTYRFEWGYHDIWLKMGLFGLIAWVCIFISFAIAACYTIKTHGHAWLISGLFAGVIALFIIHIFSPFLNHPIGIGYLLYILPFFDFSVKNTKMEFSITPPRLPTIVSQKSTVTVARR